MELMIAQKIKKYRKERELTQDALASALGVSPQSVSKWEMDQALPQIDKVLMMCNIFSVTLLGEVLDIYSVIGIIMILGATSFLVHYKIIKTKGKSLIDDLQFKIIICVRMNLV